MQSNLAASKHFTIGDSIEKTWQFEPQAVKAFATLAGDFIHFTGEIYNREQQVCTIGHAKLLSYW